MLLLLHLFLIKALHAVSLRILNENAKIPVNPDSPVILFDLDHTLYRRNGTNGNYASSIIEYIQEYEGLSKREAKNIFQKFRNDYDAVVVKGLVRELGIDPEHFENFIERRSNLKYTLKPDLEDIELIKSIRIPNQHALKCLKLLHLQDLFDGIIYVDYSVDNFDAKPDRDSYLQAMCLIGQPRPDKIYFVDDTVSYVLGAKKLGWNAIYLDEFHRYDKENSVIPRISKLQELRDRFPKIFSNGKDKSIY